MGSILSDAVRARRSIRSFRDEPVGEDLIREIIGDAVWAPSWSNTQPWEIIVVTGEKLRLFKEENRKSLLEGNTAAPEIPMPMDLPETLKQRRMDLARNIYESLSINRDDADARLKYYADMYYLFDAPALVLFVVDRELALEYTMLDLGCFLQTFFLVAHEKGLGACTFAGTVHSPHVVHKLLGVPDSKLLAIGAAVGWPDTGAPVNNFPRNRGNVDDFVTWLK